MCISETWQSMAEGLGYYKGRIVTGYHLLFPALQLVFHFLQEHAFFFKQPSEDRDSIDSIPFGGISDQPHTRSLRGGPGPKFALTDTDEDFMTS